MGRCGDGGSLANKVYMHVKQGIRDGELRPGDEIVETNIVGDLKVSRTPVRNAIYRLEAEGLVRIVPNKGYFVRRYDFNDYVNMLQVREVVEGLCAGLACRKCTDSDIERLRAYYPDRDAPFDDARKDEYLHKGFEMHADIIRLADNNAATEELEAIAIKSKMVAIRNTELGTRTRESYYEHLGIIEAFEKRDPALAERRMKNHIKRIGTSIFQVYFNYGDPVG